MDISTFLGFASGIGTVVLLMVMGGSVSLFYDIHAVIVIGGGCFSATLIRFPLKTIAVGLASGAKVVFFYKRQGAQALIEQIAELADIVRKQGPLGLESVEIKDGFLSKGVRMIADGYDGEVIREALEKEAELHLQRMKEGVKVYKAVGDMAPAWGMIGTIIGMVQMFANMSDPSKLGPFMAVALLATLYGAVLANLIMLPIGDKLELRLHQDEILEQLIIDGVMQMRENKSPAFIKEMLISYLPHKQRHHFEDEAA